MSPAKGSTSNDTMVTTTTVTELVKPLSQMENSKKEEPVKKAVDFSVIIDEQLNKNKLYDDKIKLEVRHIQIN